ncbi:MAG: phospho-N-acetylmuramoyl-pentapeptide-transferase [Clostridia bacterium]|nr:phospho-N-acetylmuramoyl-pentapeptide-transferase [Clostridia bacterium]
MKNGLSAAIVAFALSFIFCMTLIPALKRFKAGQNILSYVKEHKSKGGTPTMGGLAFIPAASIASALFIQKVQRTEVLCIVVGLAFMIVGLIDDFLKQKHKENLGLKAWQKFAFQAFIAIFAGAYCLRTGLTALYLPFTGKQVDIGVGIFPLAVFAFLATVNAVNLTDGLDGLAAGSAVPFFLSVGIIIYTEGKNASESVICFALVGALLAYLLFNTSPASVFMGDTGSLALGGFAAGVSIFTGNILYIVVIGATFVFSVISVLMQVIYYKATGGKRIFLMSPVHHHFQQKGYSESKIAYAYFTVTSLLGAIAVLAVI